MKEDYCQKAISNDLLQFSASSSYRLSKISVKTYNRSKAPGKLKECADRKLFNAGHWRFGDKDCLAKYDPSKSSTCYHRLFA